MDENLEFEDRPLTEEERRENLRKILGEDKADVFFDGLVAPGGGASSVDDVKVVDEPNSGINWKLIGIFAVIFVLVMIGAGAVAGAGIQEETIDTPVSVFPQNGFR